MTGTRPRTHVAAPFAKLTVDDRQRFAHDQSLTCILTTVNIPGLPGDGRQESGVDGIPEREARRHDRDAPSERRRDATWECCSALRRGPVSQTPIPMRTVPETALQSMVSDTIATCAQNAAFVAKSDGQESAEDVVTNCRVWRAYSTVTLFARLRGWSTFDPRFTAT